MFHHRRTVRNLLCPLHLFFQYKSYSGQVKVVHNHMSHIQVMLTWVCHCLIRFTSSHPCLISNSGHCAQGLFEPEWALGLFRHAEELQAALETCQHHSSQQPLTVQGATAWCSSAQHFSYASRLLSSPSLLVSSLLFSSLLFSSLLFSSLLFSSLLFSSLLFSSRMKIMSLLYIKHWENLPVRGNVEP